MAVQSATTQPQISQDMQAGFDEQRRMNAEGFAQSMAMMNLQREQAKQTEAIAALSNTMKNAHDSAMLVINNAKG
ncbi:MAG: hypothetical protein H0X72_16335 [Acidobacteria bacterium]|jgi:hypothetical protein|nr:hypothetical protein [Acidobacteriota bacterium]